MVLQRGATGIILLEFRYTPVLLSTKPVCHAADLQEPVLNMATGCQQGMKMRKAGVFRPLVLKTQERS